MNCVEIGALRAYLDRELDAAEVGRIEHHLATCGACRSRLAELQEGMELVDQALSSVAKRAEEVSPRFSTAQALARVRFRLVAGKMNAGAARNLRATTIKTAGRFTMFREKYWPQIRLALAGAVAILALGLITLTPQGQVAASNFLAQFRAQQLKVVAVDPRELRTVVEDLSHFGTVDAGPNGFNSMSTVLTLDEAAKRAGFAVKQPTTLPPEVKAQGGPTIAVKASSSITFTIDVARAQAYLASIGEKSFSIPPKFDGAKLQLYLPSAVMLAYGQGNSMLLVGEAGSPSGEVQGNVSPAEMRDLVLTLPGLSPATVAQLKGIEDWMNTLPVPLPKDQATWHDVDLGGIKGISARDKASNNGFVIWQQNGYVYGVGGPFSEETLLTVAKSLR